MDILPGEEKDGGFYLWEIPFLVMVNTIPLVVLAGE
jgi:hypothetical protein